MIMTPELRDDLEEALHRALEKLVGNNDFAAAACRLSDLEDLRMEVDGEEVVSTGVLDAAQYFGLEA